MISQFPWPINSPGEVVEIFLPGGVKTTQSGQTQTNVTGQISIYETRADNADALALGAKKYIVMTAAHVMQNAADGPGSADYTRRWFSWSRWCGDNGKDVGSACA